MAKVENIALFDMDGTLCDYESSLLAELNKIRSTEEPKLEYIMHKNVPDYIKARKDLIINKEEWWANLPKFQLGFDIWKIAEELGYRKMILTQAPRKNPNALSGKLKWIQKNLGDVEFTMTRDKGLVYGKILVDDFPEYINRWLDWRPRGLVIMPANDSNKDYKHDQVIRYDGSNLEYVKEAMEKAKLKPE